MDDDDSPADQPPSADEPFDRIVCGVDGSRAGEEAVRQAVAACEASARIILESARRLTTGLEVVEREFEGEPAGAILGAIERYGATVVAVGSHGKSRIERIVSGSVATTVVHRAPCSVLVARAPRPGRRFASKVVAGLDGSPASRRAVGIAEQLAGRLGADLAVVSAAGASVDLAETSQRVSRAVHIDDRERVACQAPASVLVVRDSRPTDR